MRVGLGYDVHRLVRGRRLVLGGVDLPFDKGLRGHSDADVLVHAICDALLGAAGAGDIGHHFPDTDPRYKDVASIDLLKQVNQLIASDGWQVANVDATVMAEAPKMAPYRQRMQGNIAEALGVDPARINLKATTTESLGSIGRGEAIAAMCVALLNQK